MKNEAMIQNDNFNIVLAGSGMSMYALSKLSGVPYTTVNEIHRGKVDINQCAAGTVHRLAGVLDVQPDRIMNPINYLDGVKGRYKGIDFEWTTDGTTHLLFEYDGEQVDLDTDKTFNIPSRLKYYNIIAGWMIDEYIDHVEWQKAAKKKLEKARNDRRVLTDA